MSPYGVAAGECIARPSAQTLARWHKAAPTSTTTIATDGQAKDSATKEEQHVPSSSSSTLLGGRVYGLTRLAEKPTAEFARKNLVTPGLGPAEEGGEGRHLVVFGQYVLPAKRTFDILAENIRLGRRERCVRDGNPRMCVG